MEFVDYGNYLDVYADGLARIEPHGLNYRWVFAVNRGPLLIAVAGLYIPRTGIMGAERLVQSKLIEPDRPYLLS